MSGKRSLAPEGLFTGMRTLTDGLEQAVQGRRSELEELRRTVERLGVLSRRLHGASDDVRGSESLLRWRELLRREVDRAEKAIRRIALEALAADPFPRERAARNRLATEVEALFELTERLRPARDEVLEVRDRVEGQREEIREILGGINRSSVAEGGI